MFPLIFVGLLALTTIENVIKLARENRNASIINCLIYIDNQDNYQVFERITKGKLIDPINPDTDKKLISADVLIPEGYNKTFSELKNSDEFKKSHNRYQALKEFINFLNK